MGGAAAAAASAADEQFEASFVALADGMHLDCYPYPFSPLLLFAQEQYFDKGYSNYNAVAQFFRPIMPLDMCDNVLFERKNMLYDELLEYVTQRRMLVTCCIDAHFTAFAMNVRAADDDAVVDDDAEAMATLRRAAARLQAGCASVGRVNGALVHVRDGAPLPENQGVQSSTYSIELVDW